MSSVRKPPYFVKRVSKPGEPSSYHVHTRNNVERVTKKPQGWFACTRYHATLRDAIIYAAYGL